MKNQTLALLRADPLRRECLFALRELALPQGMICAGFVRNLIWDAVHQHPIATPLRILMWSGLIGKLALLKPI